MSEVGTKQAALDVIYLAACALHNQEPEKELLDKIEWNELYWMAKRHSMTAAVCMALETGHAFLKMDPALVKQWQDEKDKSIRKTMLMDEECREIMGFMESHGIWYMPMKGLVIKDLYPRYGMRQMADYDILFDYAGREKMQAYMAGRGYEKEDAGTEVRDAYCMAPVYNFELHWAFFGKIYHPVWYDYYKNVKERLLPDGALRYRFCDEDFYIYTTVHAYKHYSGSGTGLRSLMDCYVYCQAKKDTMDWRYIQAQLELLGLIEFEQTSRELASCLFAEPDPDFIDALTEKQRETLEYFIGSGTYGTTTHRIENKLHALQQDGESVSTTTRLRYLWRRFVPDQMWFRLNAPFCYRHKWSIPFFVIYRALKGLILRRKQLGREIKTVRKAK